MEIDINQFMPILAKYGIVILGAIIVFLIGRMIAKRLGRATENLMDRNPNSDPSLSRFVGGLVQYLVLVFAIMAALTVLGVNTSSFSAIILGFGAAMAFVMQGSLSNIAAGVMLILFKPFKIDDEVEVGGVSGKITDISLTATRLKSADNREFIVSNGDVWGGTIKNLTSLGTRRLDMQFGIDYGADIDMAIKALTETAAAHPLVLHDPSPWAKVVTLNDSSVDLELRAWCNSSDYKALKASISRPVKAAFDKAGIGIPYPHEIKIKQKVKSSKARARVARLTKLRQKTS